MLKQINNNSVKVMKLFRSPTLETVRMVEKTIEEYSGEFKKTILWEKLPKQVQWRTFLTILDYLQEINKIVISDNGVITYIWNPESAKKYLAQEYLHYDYVKEKKQTSVKS